MVYLSNKDGATAIEYALIAGSISVAIAATVLLLGNTVLTNFFAEIAASFS